MTGTHHPVMLDAVLDLLAPAPGKRIVDATAGAGGHAEAIARRIGSSGELIVLDRDPEMLELAAKRLAPLTSRVRMVHARMSRMADVVAEAGLERLDGVLLDLGLCSDQLDDPARGFRFRPADGPVPLDMRMDRTVGETAADLLERLDEEELADILRDGGVPRARTVARAIRRRLPIRAASDLVRCVEGVRLPDRRHHPATLLFQALRIAVNDEYEELERTLDAVPDLLDRGGRLAVLSYHSGEDRRVKEFLAREARGCICPPGIPVCGCGHEVRMRVLLRGERPSGEEVSRNPRSRSARLRGGERT